MAASHADPQNHADPAHIMQVEWNHRSWDIRILQPQIVGMQVRMESASKSCRPCTHHARGMEPQIVGIHTHHAGGMEPQNVGVFTYCGHRSRVKLLQIVAISRNHISWDRCAADGCAAAMAAMAAMVAIMRTLAHVQGSQGWMPQSDPSD